MGWAGLGWAGMGWAVMGWDGSPKSSMTIQVEDLKKDGRRADPTDHPAQLSGNHIGEETDDHIRNRFGDMS